jgi:hypothetical protein
VASVRWLPSQRQALFYNLELSFHTRDPHHVRPTPNSLSKFTPQVTPQGKVILGYNRNVLREGRFLGAIIRLDRVQGINGPETRRPKIP